MASSPAGVGLTLGTETATAPFTLDVIQGSALPITAPSPATVGGTTYQFTGWSDGGALTHAITAARPPRTYTANYQAVAGADARRRHRRDRAHRQRRDARPRRGLPDDAPARTRA